MGIQLNPVKNSWKILTARNVRLIGLRLGCLVNGHAT